MRIGRCLQKVILIWSIKTHLYANWNDSVERENFMIREKGDNYKNKVLKLSKKKKKEYYPREMLKGNRDTTIVNKGKVEYGQSQK